MCKSQPTDDKLTLKGAWSRHVTHFKFLVILRYLWGEISKIAITQPPSLDCAATWQTEGLGARAASSGNASLIAHISSFNKCTQQYKIHLIMNAHAFNN